MNNNDYNPTDRFGNFEYDVDLVDEGGKVYATKRDKLWRIQLNNAMLDELADELKWRKPKKGRQHP